MRKLLLLSVIVLALMVAAALTPAPVQAANGCGPSLLSLYVVIPDRISYFHITRWQWETFDFTQACNNHDNCYASSGIDRATCDSIFYSQMLAVCNRGWTWASRNWCSAAAWTYYQAVRTFGEFAYQP